MKIDKDKFYNKFNDIIDNYNANSNIVKAVANDMTRHNVLPVETNAIMTRTKAGERPDIKLLYLILKYTYNEVLQRPEFKDMVDELDPKIYFTDIEMQEYDAYKATNIKDKIDFPLVFEPVIRIADDQFITKIDIKRMNKMFDSGIVGYSLEMQRNPKIKIVDGKAKKYINLNNNAVNSIEKKMEENKFIPNTLTINLVSDGTDNYEYDENNLRLIIKSGKIFNTDGYHRNSAIFKVLRKNPNKDFTMELRITNFDVEKANQFIVQEDIRNPIDKGYIKSIDSDRPENIIIKKLNESNESELRNKITTDRKLIKNNEALVLSSTLIDAIAYNFKSKLETKKDAFDIAKWLTIGFNEIMGSYPNEFIKNIKETKEYSLINDDRMFVGYVALLSKLQDNPEWEERLLYVMDNIDFSRDNIDWKSMGLFNKNLTNPTIKKISEYFIKRIR